MTIFQKLHNEILELRGRMRHAENCLSLAKENLQNGWDPYDSRYGDSEHYERYCHQEIKDYKFLVNEYRKELEQKNKEYKTLIKKKNEHNG